MYVRSDLSDDSPQKICVTPASSSGQIYLSTISQHSSEKATSRPNYWMPMSGQLKLLYGVDPYRLAREHADANAWNTKFRSWARNRYYFPDLSIYRISSIKLRTTTQDFFYQMTPGLLQHHYRLTYSQIIQYKHASLSFTPWKADWIELSCYICRRPPSKLKNSYPSNICQKQLKQGAAILSLVLCDLCFHAN